jgi:hypothetical protein
MGGLIPERWWWGWGLAAGGGTAAPGSPDIEEVFDELVGGRFEEGAAAFEGAFAQALLSGLQVVFDGASGGGGGGDGRQATQALTEHLEVVVIAEVFLELIEAGDQAAEALGVGGQEEGELVKERLGGGSPIMEALGLTIGVSGAPAFSKTSVAAFESGPQQFPAVAFEGGSKEGLMGLVESFGGVGQRSVEVGWGSGRAGRGWGVEFEGGPGFLQGGADR